VRVRRITGTSIEELAAPPVGARVGDGADLVWVDLDHTEAQGMTLLPQLFDVRAVDIEDCHVRTPVPKLHLYPDHHYTSINGLARGTDQRLHLQPLKIFQHPHLLVTVLGPTSAALNIDSARHELGAVHRRLDDDGFRPATSLELITAIRREMMGTLERLIGTTASRIADLEGTILRADPVKSERLLDEVFALRHDLQTIRTSAAQAHQSYSNLLERAERSDGLLTVDVPRVTELRQGFWHVMQTTDLEREYLQEMLDLFQTRVATELNRFVRRVTAWGTVGIAWTVIVGIYGMNFVAIPGLAAPWGFWAILGAMAAVAVVLAVFFRRHGWL
jgi:Mg2+ and Co2+ transporter CorA